jgi:hypothetical protein
VSRYRYTPQTLDGYLGMDPSQEAGAPQDDDRYDDIDKLRATKARIAAAIAEFHRREAAKTERARKGRVA